LNTPILTVGRIAELYGGPSSRAPCAKCRAEVLVWKIGATTFLLDPVVRRAGLGALQLGLPVHACAGPKPPPRRPARRGKAVRR
jgi:hypothetical protein